MPHEWNNMIVVTKDELVPDWYGTWSNLKVTLHRYANKPYGLKRVQFGGNGRQLLIAFDSLPEHIQNGLGDPRKVSHILERFYKVDSEAVSFFATYQFDDGTYLDVKYQERYIINASVLKAVIALRSARIDARKAMGGNLIGLNASLCSDAASFQKTLKVKHNVTHTLPENERRFKDALKAFEKEGYGSLISRKHKNQNTRKVTDITLDLLRSMFAGMYTKPTATQVYRDYGAFLSGHLEVINNETGEVYDPVGFKKLSTQTVTNYMAQWSVRIGTHAARSGNRQQYMQDYKPYHSLDKPKFAGSIISIDDRQPPFKMLDGKRVWFYNAYDIASECFTCWVYGKSKEGIIRDFYQQLIRNYAEWGFHLPAELECESSLNSSFKDTFLKEGSMFQHVRIEANNARGKYIERVFGTLRYQYEKNEIGWLARPNSLKESNQVGPKEVKELPYDQIVEIALRNIEDWNNQPHTIHKDKSRWEVFCEMQNPYLKETNYQSILPHIGYHTATSVHVGILKLQRKEFLLGRNGQICTGESLIKLMQVVEGRDVDVYWLDDNDGNVLKAVVFIGNLFICEAIAKPTYNRAKIEQTPADELKRELMSKYVATIEAYGRRQKHSIERITIIDNTPALKKTFVMRGLKQSDSIKERVEPEILEDIPFHEEFNLPAKSFSMSLKDRF